MSVLIMFGTVDTGNPETVYFNANYFYSSQIRFMRTF